MNRFEHDFPLSLSLVHGESYSKSNSESQNLRSELMLMEKGLKLNSKPPSLQNRPTLMSACYAQLLLYFIFFIFALTLPLTGLGGERILVFCFCL